MDVCAVTDYAGIRLKSVIHSSAGESLLITPREGRYIVRFYVDFGDFDPNDREARSRFNDADSGGLSSAERQASSRSPRTHPSSAALLSAPIWIRSSITAASIAPREPSLWSGQISTLPACCRSTPTVSSRSSSPAL